MTKKKPTKKKPAPAKRRPAKKNPVPPPGSRTRPAGRGRTAPAADVRPVPSYAQPLLTPAPTITFLAPDDTTATHVVDLPHTVQVRIENADGAGYFVGNDPSTPINLPALPASISLNGTTCPQQGVTYTLWVFAWTNDLQYVIDSRDFMRSS
jgi:hypothetical protein